MLRAVQNRFNHGSESRRRKPGKSTDVRTQTLAAINATWRKLCPLDGDELRAARLDFATKALKLKKPLKSLGQCSPKQLGIVIDAMRVLERAQTLPGIAATDLHGSSQIGPKHISGNPRSSVADSSAEIIHLATSAQGTAIERLRNYLDWSAIGLQNFIVDKFNGKHSPALLTPAEANSCTMILMTIAARKRIVARMSVPPAVAGGPKPKISRTLIHAEIPALKRELNIDQKPFTLEGANDGR